jgi:hypothetical protein
MYSTLQNGVNRINAVSESVSGEMGYIQSGPGEFGIFVWSRTPVTVNVRHANGTWSVFGETTSENKTMSIYFEDYEAVHVTAASDTVVRMSYIDQPKSTGASSQTTSDISDIPAYTIADAGSVLSTDNDGNLVWVPLSSLGAEAVREYQSTEYVESTGSAGDGGGDGGGDPAPAPGIDQYGASVILEGQQSTSYLNQLLPGNTEFSWDPNVDNGQLVVNKVGAGFDNNRYFLFTESFTPADMANDTEYIFRFIFRSTQPSQMRYGLMAENDLEAFSEAEAEENAVLWATARQNESAKVYSKGTQLNGNAGNSVGGRALVFSKDAGGNLTIKMKLWNYTYSYYIDSFTYTNNATFNANFDPTQPLRFFVYYPEQHNTVLFDNYETLEQ